MGFVENYDQIRYLSWQSPFCTKFAGFLFQFLLFFDILQQGREEENQASGKNLVYNAFKVQKYHENPMQIHNFGKLWEFCRAESLPESLGVVCQSPVGHG